MIEGVNNPSLWWLLLPAALLALSGMFPAQHYIHIFQLESYKRPQFFMRLKEDTSYQDSLAKYRRKVSFIIFSLLLVLIIPITAIFRDAFWQSFVFLTAGSIVMLIAMLLRYRKWKKRNNPQKNH